MKAPRKLGQTSPFLLSVLLLVTVMAGPALATAGAGFLHPDHAGNTWNQKLGTGDDATCPVEGDGFGWHFVIPSTGDGQFAAFTSLTATFSTAGVVTAPPNGVIGTGNKAKHAWLFTPTADTIVTATAVVDLTQGTGPVRFNLSHTCNGNQIDEASATIETGECVFSSDASSTPVTITVTPSEAVTVTVKEGTTVLHTITSTTTIYLAPGSYTWEAEAADGYALTTPAEGTIETDDCTPRTDSKPAAASVSPGACVFNVASSTPITSTINPADGASVVLTRATGGFTHTFSGVGGSVSVSPGTYNWVATAASGYSLTGTTSGTFQALNCAVLAEVFENPGPKKTAVLGVQFAAAALPRTGASVAWMLWFALTAMLTGLWMTMVARARGYGYRPRHKAPREWRWEMSSLNG